MHHIAPSFPSAKRHLRSVGKYGQQLRDHILPHLGARPLVAVTRGDCSNYYNTRLDSGAAVATVNGEMACLKSLFSEAMDAGVSETNPVKGIRLKNPNNARDRLLSADETLRLFAAADTFDDYVRPLLYLLYYTGMRLDEALNLRWAEFEPDHDRVIVRNSKSGEGRKVPLNPHVVRELHRWKSFTGKSMWIFPNPADTSRHIRNIRKGWLRLAATAGVENLCRHDMRHNFTSMLQARGIADSTIMAITGHKTHVMLHRYSHSDDSQRLAAVSAIHRPAERAEIVPLSMARRQRQNQD